MQEISTDFLSRLAPWDGQWYLQIAHRGYKETGGTADNKTKSYQGTYAFFPLLPGILRLFSRLDTNPTPYAIVLNVCASATALLLVWVFARYLRTNANITILLCLAFPAAIFQSLLYTESLFLFISAALWMSVLKKRWALSALLGYLGGLCRPQGVLLTLLFLSVLRKSRRGQQGKILSWLAAMTPLLGLGTFMLINVHATGSPFAFLYAQSGWGRHIEPESLLNSLNELLTRTGTLPDVLGAAFGLLLLPFLWRSLPKPLAIYATALVFMPLATGKILSMGRFVSCSFPHFLCLAGLVQRHRVVFWTLSMPLSRRDPPLLMRRDPPERANLLAC